MFFRSKKKSILIGIAVVIALAIIGTVGALNGYFGGGGRIPADTFTLGLVGYWNFDEGTGNIAYDISGNEKHGQWACGGVFTDSRDSQTYNTVQIGDQCWMTENMNIGTRVDGSQEQDNDSVIQKYCFNDSDAICATDGGLYQWAQAVDLPHSCNSADCSAQIQTSHQGICPPGWHVPNNSDWTALTDYLSSDSQYWCDSNSTYIAKSLASQSGWTASANTCAIGNNQAANNLTGFTALPAGVRLADTFFYFRGERTYLWVASQESSSEAWYRYLGFSLATVSQFYINKANGYAVRCVRD